MRVCSVSGCPEIYPSSEGSRCHAHRRQADRARGNRGYGTKGHQGFRAAVIRRDPICVLCHVRPSTVADHHPHSRRELIDSRLDPNDPRRGRGLCKPCHDAETARNQPGGWHNQTP